MLTQEKISENKERFLSIINGIDRHCNKEGLIDYLNSTDFFTSPATANHFGAYEGGLCEYCLNVYDVMTQLIGIGYGLIDDIVGEGDTASIVVVSILHAIGKCNCYEKTVFNKKVYSDIGLKKDELGKYDWVSTPGYKFKETNRFILGSINENSAYIANYYVPLYASEYSAILCSSYDYSCSQSNNANIFDSYKTYKISSILHMAIEFVMFNIMGENKQ